MSAVVSIIKQENCIGEFGEVVLGDVLMYATLHAEVTTRAQECNSKDK